MTVGGVGGHREGIVDGLGQRLAELAHRDPLTGLANRARLLERLDGEAKRAGGDVVRVADRPN